MHGVSGARPMRPAGRDAVDLRRRRGRAGMPWRAELRPRTSPQAGHRAGATGWEGAEMPSQGFIMPGSSAGISLRREQGDFIWPEIPNSHTQSRFQALLPWLPRRRRSPRLVLLRNGAPIFPCWWIHTLRIQWTCSVGVGCRSADGLQGPAQEIFRVRVPLRVR